MGNIIKNILKSIAILIILFVLFIYKDTLATYVTKIKGKSTTEIAKPIFIVESTDKKTINDSNTEVDYYFTIKNYNKNGERSEVQLKYIIEISPKLDSSLILTLYKNDTKINLTNQKTNYITLEESSNQTHSYRLNVKYDRDKTNATTDIKEKIYIKASAIQS